jgi:RNA polymerase sigma-70 factor (ECF subfamily)
VGSQPLDNADVEPANVPDMPSVAPLNGIEPHSMVVSQVEGGVVAEDRLLLERLIETHHAPLYRYAYRLSGSAADAEDLVQQVFMVACRKLDQVREPEHVSGWLYAVLRSCFLKSCRKTRPQSAGGMELNLNLVPETKAAPQEIDSDELQGALDLLPPEYRLVVVMFYFEHCSYKQIAERLELPIGTVMSRLARAKQRLRAELGEREALEVRLADRPPAQPEATAARRSVGPGR